MKKIDKRIKKYKDIITINPYIESFYKYKNKKLKNLKKLSYNDKQYTISYIANKDMIITSLDLGYSSSDEEEIYDGLYDKAYEELGLDEEKEYALHYEKRESDPDLNIYNVFITEEEVIERQFANTVAETKYIDLMVPAPLLFKGLYRENILDKQDAHCYIYFTMTDAFVCIYNDGNFIYSKSLEYSLEQIYEKYCALTGDRVDKKEFFEILDSEGLKTTNTTYQQNLMKIFGDIFLQINDIVIYAKRAYNIESIQKLFLGSVSSPIIGLSDYGYNYLGIPTFNLDFTFDIKNDEWYVDQLQYLMVKSALDYIEEPEKILNVSTFPRPPIFVKRASGQFILTTVAASVVAFGAPLFYLVPAYTYEGYNATLVDDDQKLSKEAAHYKQVLKEKQDTIKKKKGELKNLKKIFNNKAQTLTHVYDKKVNYHFKSEFLYIFSKDLEKHHIHLERMISHEDSFELYLMSRDEKNITRYIKDVSKKYQKEIRSIDIKRIEFDEKTFEYHGILKVKY